MRRYQLIPSHAVQTLLITSVSPLPSGEIGAPYSFTFNAIGGVAPYSWSEVGAIPSGLTFSGGTLSGTPSGTFSSSFNVTVTDSVGSQFTKSFSLTVITAVQITTASPLPGGTVGVAYSTTIAATGGATPYSWSILGFTGANSYSINSVTGVLTGTLGVAEIDSINIQVVDALGIPSAKNFNLTVIPAASLTITTSSPLPAATQSSFYSTTMAATGGTSPYTWSLVSQTGTNGWSVSSGGVVSGTPGALETDSLIIKVTDSLAATSSGTFSLQVNAAGVGFNLFVSTSGVQANSGTLASPLPITVFQDTNAKNGSLAGKRIGLIAGTYDLGTLQSGSQPGDNEHPILHLPAGTSGSPTYVASCDVSGNYSARTATLNWNNNSSSNSMIGQNPDLGGWWTVDGLTFRGSNTGASAKRIGYYQSGTSAGPATIINNDFGPQTCGPATTGSNDGTIFEDGPIGTVIFNNLFNNVQKPAQADHGHAYCGFTTKNTQFTQNTVVTCCTGMDGKVNVNNCTTARNYFYNCGTAGNDSATIQGYDGDQNTTNTPCFFLNNVFDSNPGILRTVDVASNHIMQPNTIANNTAYFIVAGANSVWDLRAGTNNTPGASAQGNITFHDNITVTTLATGAGPPSGRLGLTSTFVPLCDFNCYFASNGNLSAMWALSGTAQSSLANWRSATGFDTHGINANPGFTITPGNGPNQFQILSGPCFGTGTGGVNIGAWDGAVTQIGADWVTYPVT